MVAALLRLRFLAAVVAIVCGIHALAFVVIGITRGVEGYRMILQSLGGTASQYPGVELARSLDAFLIAMVLVVFAVGITELFVVRPDHPSLAPVPQWMRVNSLSELKFLLWEALLVTLVVSSVENLVVSGHDPTWMSLVLPVATLILAVGLYLLKKVH